MDLIDDFDKEFIALMKGKLITLLIINLLQKSKNIQDNQIDI